MAQLCYSLAAQTLTCTESVWAARLAMLAISTPNMKLTQKQLLSVAAVRTDFSVMHLKHSQQLQNHTSALIMTMQLLK